MSFLKPFLFFSKISKNIEKKYTSYLQKSRFYYEEASWFDGQYWEKPLSVIKKDRFFLIFGRTN